MNPDDPAIGAGLLVGALMAGAFCGALPLILGLSRKRIDLAAMGMVVCVVAGVLGGLLLAVPAAGVCTAIILAVGKKKPPYQSADPRDDWDYLPPGEVTSARTADPAAVQSTGVQTAAPTPMLYRQNELALQCPSCGSAIFPDVDRLPPWCKHCGADIKAPKPVAAQDPAPLSPAPLARQS